MKKIIPFHKEIPFKTNLEEVTSISLEHTIHPEKEKVEGDFIVSGEYKISDNSNCVESFSYELPFEAEFPNCNLDKALIDIHDFYYEIMNSSILTVHIELCVQNIIEDPVIVEPDPEPIKEVEEVIEAVEGINAAMKKASSASFGYTEEPLVSSDIIGITYGSLFDATQTMVTKIDDNTYQVQVVAWYDNENSYTSQMVRTIKYFAELK